MNVGAFAFPVGMNGMIDASAVRGLEAGALERGVVEVAPSPGRPPAARATGEGSRPWGWIAIAASAGAVLLAVLAARGWRRRAARGTMAT
jgi:hypothetical protein